MNLLIPLLVALAVVVIYLLRTPPRPIIIPSNYLWEKLAKRSRPLRERLRWLLSLLLAMAVACSMAWALIKSPQFGGGRGETALAIVIDNSATMGANRSAGGSRLDEALTIARRAINNNRGPIVVADTAGQISSFSYSDAERARDLLNRIHVDFSDGHRYPPLPEPPRRTSTRTLYLTDGVGGPDPSTTEDAGSEDNLVVQSVFEAAHNVGITAFDTRRAPDGKLYLYIELVHASDQANDVRLIVEEATASRLDRTLTLDHNELWSGVIDVTGWTSPLSASVELLGGDDALSADNRAWKLISREEPARILLLSDRPEGLVALLRATGPGVVVQTLSTTQLYSQQSAPGFWDDFDVLVADRTAPREPPPIPTWWVAPPNAPYLPRSGSAITIDAVAEATERAPRAFAAEQAGTASGDPITDLDLSDNGLASLAVKRVQQLDVDSLDEGSRRDSRILATAGGHPLVVAWEGHTANVLQTFDIPNREFVMSPVMPVLAADLISSLRESESNSQPGPFYVDGTVESVVTLASTTPNAESLASSATPSFHNPKGAALAGRLPSATFFSEPGLYRILFRSTLDSDPSQKAEQAAHRDVSVNLKSRTLSQINQPRLESTSASTTSTTSEVDTRRTVPWRSLVLVALILGVIEWFTFNRKVTI